MNYLNAARRYWWIVLVGVAMACITGIGLLYKVDRSFPPQLSKRAKPVFNASTELLVDSPSGPYLRTVSRAATGALKSINKGSTTTNSSSSAGATIAETKPLIDAANLFPLFVESDAVYAIRRKLVGDIPGAVHAKALYSTQGVNRFRPSLVPVLQISATAPRPKFAIALTEGTARAFEIWLKRQQDLANIPPNQRIIVRQLRVPTGTTATGGTALGLPGLASFAVLALFIALAILVDQRRTGKRAGGELRPFSAHEVDPTAHEVDPTEQVERGNLALSATGPRKPSA